MRSDDIRLLKYIVSLDLSGNVNEVPVNQSSDQIDFAHFLKQINK